MSESQSFIETTLPPGYEVGPGFDACEWAFVVVGVHPARWHSSREDACRAAWRHWTAAVLRGRDVEWGDNECEGRWVMAGCDSLDPYAYAARGGEIGIVHVDRKCVVASGDIDEAAARFAALVLATEGMVQR
jgi:hypothetical protein